VLGGELEFMATVTHSSKVSREIAGKIEIQIDWEASGEKSLDDLKYVGDLYYYLYIGLASTYSYGLLLQCMGDGTFIRRVLLSIEERDTAAVIWLSEHAQRMKVRII
jgi:hypothetical protein